MLEYLVPLIVMPEDDDPITKGLLGPDYARVTVIIVQGCLGLEVYCGGYHNRTQFNAGLQILAPGIDSANAAISLQRYRFSQFN